MSRAWWGFGSKQKFPPISQDLHPQVWGLVTGSRVKTCSGRIRAQNSGSGSGAPHSLPLRQFGEKRTTDLTILLWLTQCFSLYGDIKEKLGSLFLQAPEIEIADDNLHFAKFTSCFFFFPWQENSRVGFGCFLAFPFSSLKSTAYNVIFVCIESI